MPSTFSRKDARLSFRIHDLLRLETRCLLNWRFVHGWRDSFTFFLSTTSFGDGAC